MIQTSLPAIEVSCGAPMRTVTRDRQSYAAILVALACSHCGGCGDFTLTQVPVSLEVAPPALDFEATPITLTRSKTFSITNTGGVALHSLTVEISGEGFALREAPSAVISAGQTIQVTVDFTPSATGQVFGSARVRAEIVPDLTVALTGQGSGLADCDDGNSCTEDVPQLDSTCAHAAITGSSMGPRKMSDEGRRLPTRLSRA